MWSRLRELIFFFFLSNYCWESVRFATVENLFKLTNEGHWPHQGGNSTFFGNIILISKLILINSKKYSKVVLFLMSVSSYCFACVVLGLFCGKQFLHMGQEISLQASVLKDYLTPSIRQVACNDVTKYYSVPLHINVLFLNMHFVIFDIYKLCSFSLPILS